MKDDLLWVYEGLTNYYGELLARARGPDLAAGLAGRDRGRRDGRQPAGPHVAAAAGHRRFGAVPLHGRRRLGRLARQRERPAVFYNEGTLIWLEADVTIRKLTKGRKRSTTSARCSTARTTTARSG